MCARTAHAAEGSAPRPWGARGLGGSWVGARRDGVPLWGASPPWLWGGWVLFTLSSLQPISSLVCSLFSSFKEWGPLPQPSSGLPFGTGTPRTPTHPLGTHWGHQPGRSPPATHCLTPTGAVGQRGCSAPIPQPCRPYVTPGLALGMGGWGDAWVPSRLPKGAGPRGARGRALRSPSWLTHSPHCGCEVPRECSSSREHPEVGAALPRTPPPPPQPPSTPNPPACSGEGTAWGPSVPRSGCGLAPCPRAGCGPTAQWGWQVPWGRRCGVRVTRSHCSRCSVLGARLPVRHGERIPPRPPPSISPTPRGRRGRNGARLRALT